MSASTLAVSKTVSFHWPWARAQTRSKKCILFMDTEWDRNHRQQDRFHSSTVTQILFTDRDNEHNNRWQNRFHEWTTRAIANTVDKADHIHRSRLREQTPSSNYILTTDDDWVPSHSLQVRLWWWTSKAICFTAFQSTLDDELKIKTSSQFTMQMVAVNH